MKIGAAGMNGQMPVTPHADHCPPTRGTPDEDRSAERRVTQVAFLGHALPHR